MYNSKNSLVYLFVIVSLVCSLICGCMKRHPTPEQTVEELQIALNSYDIEGTLNCISNDHVQLLSTLLSVSVSEDNINSQKCLDFLKVVLPALPMISGGSILEDALPMVELEVLHSEIDGDYAKTNVSGIVTLGEKRYPFETTLDMKLEEERWVICGLDR